MAADYNGFKFNFNNYYLHEVLFIFLFLYNSYINIETFPGIIPQDFP